MLRKYLEFSRKRIPSVEENKMHGTNYNNFKGTNKSTVLLSLYSNNLPYGSASKTFSFWRMKCIENFHY